MSIDHEKQSRLLALTEQLAGVGHWTFNVVTEKITWSDEVYRIHGLPNTGEEPDRQKTLALYSADDGAALADMFAHALATGEGYQLEATITRPDGVRRQVVAKAECILDAGGEVTDIVGIFQDMTDRSRAARFSRMLAENMPAMIGYWDAGLICRYANQNYEEWFGRPAEQVIGITMRELMGERLFALNEPHARGALAGEQQEFERSLTKPSGKVGHVLARYIPDFDHRGRVRGFVVLVTDVTDLKTAELDLQQSNDALVEALKHAEEAVEVKRQFVSNVSHELRSPLTSIIGFSDLLAAHDNLDDIARRHVARVQDAAGILLSTVNDLLEYGKIDSGRVEIEHHPFDPMASAVAVIDLFEPQLRAKGVHSRLSHGPVPVCLVGDSARIRQVLLNLIGNAVKFTATGSVSLHVAYDEPGGLLRFTVTDTGPGIPAEHVSKLFQRFSQADPDVARRYGGTGLGLAISRGLAEAMGGSVGVDSTPGQGSTFWFEIPCAICDPVEAETEAFEGAIQIGELSGLRLLIVDDNSANRELARVIVEAFGVNVTEAHGGAEAITAALARPFDIILLDIRMPDIDGVAVARHIRGHAGPNQSVPLIAYTADVDGGLLAESGGPFDARLTKPIRAAELLALLLQFRPAATRPR